MEETQHSLLMLLAEAVIDMEHAPNKLLALKAVFAHYKVEHAPKNEVKDDGKGPTH